MPDTLIDVRPSPETVNILVVGSLAPPDVGDYLISVLRELSSGVRDALERAGAQARFIDVSGASRPSIRDALEGVHGLLILGGADADPACYGQACASDTNYGIDPEADRYELALLQEAEERGLAVLGICRGMQLINIRRGGDLVQEIGIGTMHNGTADNSIMVSHPVTALPGSRLAQIFDGRTLHVRSGHHQAVGRIGQGLRVTARAADGIIEAIESDGPQWTLGVQWHPEDPQAPREDFDALIHGFLSAARRENAALVPQTFMAG